MKFAVLLKRFFSAAIITLILLFFASPAFAQATPYNTPNTNPDVPRNLHTWTQNVMIEVMSTMVCQLAGVDPINPSQKCLGIDQNTGKIGFVDPSSDGGGGALGVMNTMFAVLYTPPLHTSDYFKDLGQHFGIVKPAYAQGVGFTGLSPLLPIWKAFRDIVYLLFVAIFVFVGLAIMLRLKIDPRTVMSIGNQLPKIIVGILFVTFSFAIAGFLIDIMYVSIYVVFNIISGIPGANLTGLNPTLMQGQNALEAANAINTGGGVLGQGGIFGVAMTLTSSIVGIIMSFAGIGGPGGGFFDISPVNGLIHALAASAGIASGVQVAQIQTPSIFGWSLGGVAGIPLGLAAGSAVTASTELLFRNILPNLIVFLIIFIALLFAMLQLWIQLIRAYIMILLNTALAPFIILFGLFPGSPIGFGGWIKIMLVNITPFPVTIGMFLLGRLFIDFFGTTQNTQFVPPLIGNPSNSNNIGALIGMGIILVTPQVVNMMQDLIKAPTFKFISAIGTAVGAGANIPTSAAKTTGAAYLASKAAVYDVKAAGGAGGYVAGGPIGAIKSLFKL